MFEITGSNVVPLYIFKELASPGLFAVKGQQYHSRNPREQTHVISSC